MKRLRSDVINELRTAYIEEDEKRQLSRQKRGQQDKEEYHQWGWSQITTLRWLVTSEILPLDVRLLIDDNLIRLYFQRTLQLWDHLAENPTEREPLTLCLIDGMNSLKHTLVQHALQRPNRLRVQIQNLRYSIIRRDNDSTLSNTAHCSLLGNDPTTELKRWTQRTLPSDLIIVRYTLGSCDTL